MDRFIGNRLYKIPHHCGYLKSNMDRFIAKWVSVMLRTYNNLKSNMDRFIAVTMMSSMRVKII